jgi:hypothetical protein
MVLESIRSLHVGQVVIIVVVGALCVGGLLPVNSRAAKNVRGATYGIGMDSVLAAQVVDSLVMPVHPRDTAAQRMADEKNAPLHRRFSLIMADQKDEVARRNSNMLVVIVTGALLLVAVGLTLWILWVWFGGRRRASTQ